MPVPGQLPAIIEPGALATPADTYIVPALIADLGDAAGWRYLEFFTAKDPGHRQANSCRPRWARTGSQLTLRWREMDSNFRFRAKGATDLSFRFCLCP
jgi:hypothetical protein